MALLKQDSGVQTLVWQDSRVQTLVWQLSFPNTRYVLYLYFKLL